MQTSRLHALVGLVALAFPALAAYATPITVAVTATALVQGCGGTCSDAEVKACEQTLDSCINKVFSDYSGDRSTCPGVRTKLDACHKASCDCVDSCGSGRGGTCTSDKAPSYGVCTEE
jgi:hypothetical protein